MQTYRERPPAPALARYATCVWVQAVTPGSAPHTHQTVPNGSAELMCSVGSVPRVVGPQTGPTAETLMPGSRVVGVRLRPGAAAAILGLPASELVDLSVGVDELWGDAAAELGEAVAAGGSVAALERAVAARLAGAPKLDPIAMEAARLLLPWRAGDVGSLTSSLYISESQLRRRFQAAIGVGPKVLQRMLRFQGFLALAHRRAWPSGELAGLAAQAGYADQAHLTRESLRLAGRSPRALLADSRHECAPTHDHAASYGALLGAR